VKKFAAKLLDDVRMGKRRLMELGQEIASNAVLTAAVDF
jgi:hypothetical protein